MLCTAGSPQGQGVCQSLQRIGCHALGPIAMLCNCQWESTVVSSATTLQPAHNRRPPWGFACARAHCLHPPLPGPLAPPASPPPSTPAALPAPSGPRNSSSGRSVATQSSTPHIITTTPPLAVPEPLDWEDTYRLLCQGGEALGGGLAWPVVYSLLGLPPSAPDALFLHFAASLASGLQVGSCACMQSNLAA